MMSSSHSFSNFFLNWSLKWYEYAANHVHPILQKILPDTSVLFKQDNTLCHTANMVQDWFEGYSNEFKVLTWPLNSQCLGPIGQTSPIHGGPTSKLTGLTGSAADVLVPDTTAHLQRSNRVHASMDQSCLAVKGGPTQYQAGGNNFMADWKNRCSWSKYINQSLPKSGKYVKVVVWVTVSAEREISVF